MFRKGDKGQLNVARKDKSIQKKGNGSDNPRKISLERLRKEQKKGGGDLGGRGRGKPMRGGKGGKRFNRKEGKKLPKDPAARAEMLDKEMETYWMKGGHKELGKLSLKLIYA